MRQIDDEPAPEDTRLSELASIFAAAILRLRHRIVWSDEESADGTETCLEVPPETVLSGHHG
jgi:hypothetical protein